MIYFYGDDEYVKIGFSQEDFKAKMHAGKDWNLLGGESE